MKDSLPVYKFSDITRKNIEEYSIDLEKIKHNSVVEFSSLLEIFEFISQYIYEDTETYDDGNVVVKYKIKNPCIKTLDEIVTKEDFFINKEELEKFIDQHFKKENTITVRIYKMHVNYDFSDSGIIPEKYEYFEFIQNDEIKITFEIEYITCKDDGGYTCINTNFMNLNLYIL